MMSEDSAMEPLSLPVVANTETQVDGMGVHLVVVPSSCGSGRPVGWLDTKSDSCVVDENMLDTEMSPIVSVRSAAGPAFLPTKSEVFSLAVLAGGGGSCCAPPPPPRPWSQRECLSHRLLGANFQRILMLPCSVRCV